MPDEKTLCAALDIVDVGMALVGSDRKIQYANAAFAEFVATVPTELEGASIFGSGCPCVALRAHEARWDDEEQVSVSGESPQGTMVEVVVRPVAPASDIRVVVVRRGLVRFPSGQRLAPEVVSELQEFLTRLTGHAVDPATLSAAPLSILMLGVEDLEGLRDRFGEATVEEVLRQVAQALVLQKRKADIISRYGDGQFLVIASDMPRYGAAMLADRIRDRVESLAFEVDGEPVPISLVSHTAEYRPQLDGPIEEAIEKASRATAGRASEAVG